MNRRQLFLVVIGYLAVVCRGHPTVDDVFETESLPEYSKVWRAACVHQEDKISHWTLLEVLRLPKGVSIQ